MASPGFGMINEKNILKDIPRGHGPCDNGTTIYVQYTSGLPAPQRVINITVSIIATSIAAVCFGIRLS
jgi:hypothetical protein